MLIQCALRWEELLSSSNSAVAGDFSGLTATGRPISNSRHRRPARMTNVMHDQSNSKFSSGDSTRPRSVMMSRVGSEGKSKDGGVQRSVSTEDRVWGHIQQEQSIKSGLSYRVERMKNQNREEMASRASFAANFCQNLLTKGRDQSNIDKAREDTESALRKTPSEASTDNSTATIKQVAQARPTKQY